MGKTIIAQDGMQMRDLLIEVLQDGSHERIAEFLQAVMNTPGVCLSPTASGAIPPVLEVRNAAGFNIYVTAGYAIDSAGNVIAVGEDTDSYEVSAGGPYLVLLTYATNHYEAGTVEVTFDPTEATGYQNTITGTGTNFNEFYRVGMFIKICDSATTNNGIYEITSIVSDTEMHVSDYRDGEVVPYSFVDEDELRHEAVARYASGMPASGDKRCYSVGSYSIELRDESLGYTEGTEIVLARVRRLGTTIEITDLRHWNVWSICGSLDGEIGEYLIPVAPAHVVVTTGSYDPLLPALFDPISGLAYNSFIDVEWGHHCEAATSARTYNSVTGRWRMTDSSVTGVSAWTDDLWSEAEHFLVDSENSVFKVLDSGSNWVEVEREPQAGQFWITPNAESYVVVVERVSIVDGTVEASEEATHHEMHASSPVRMTYRYRNAHSGQEYRVKVCALKNGFRSAYVMGTPNPITAGVGAPSTLPVIALTRPLTVPVSGDSYLGLLEVNITNYTACTVPEGTGAVGAIGFELYVKQGEEGDYPGISASAYRATFTGQTHRFRPEGMADSATKYANITVVPISASGRRGTPVNACILAGLSATLIEEMGDRPPSERPMPEIMEDLIALIGDLGGSGATAIINNIVNTAICGCRETCCSTCSTTPSSGEVIQQLYEKQHYINFSWPGAAVADRALLSTQMGSRYGIRVNQLRISNEAVCSGAQLLRVSADESGAASLAIPAGEKIYDNQSFGPIVKSSGDWLRFRTVSNELLNARIRFGFKIYEFGVFRDAGDVINTIEETLFDVRGGLIADKTYEVEEGVDYLGSFKVIHSEIVLQTPPTDGDLTVRIGDESGGGGNYYDIVVPDGDTNKVSLENLVIADPSTMYARVVGDPHNAAYMQINFTIEQSAATAGIYPYANGPYFDGWNWFGGDVGGVQRHIRTFLYAMKLPWCEVHLPSAVEHNCRFQISGTNPASTGYINIYIPAGQVRGENTGEILLNSNGELKIEVLEGPAQDYIVFWEAHRRS